MGHLAKADGRVTEQEIKMAKILMNEMRLNREQRNLANGYLMKENKKISNWNRCSLNSNKHVRIIESY